MLVGRILLFWFRENAQLLGRNLKLYIFDICGSDSFILRLFLIDLLEQLGFELRAV